MAEFNYDISSGLSDMSNGYGYTTSTPQVAPTNFTQNAEWLNPSLTTATPQQSWWDYLLGSGNQKTQSTSPLGQGVGALSGLMSMWNGYQANQLAQKQFEFQKQAFNTNMAAAKTSYNNSLTNQANRMAARGDSALNGMTADQYVSKYGV